MTNYLPVENPSKSYWLTAQEENFKSYRSSSTLPNEVDTLIIGSGYAGTTMAYYLLKGDPENTSLLMLEARDICSGATARNGGHLKPDLYMAYDSFKNKYGEKDAASIFNFEFDHVKEMKELIEKENIDCDFILTRACDVHFEKNVAEKAKRNYKEIMKNPFIKYKNDLQINYGENAKTISKVEKSSVCLTYTAGHVWVYKLIIALLKSSIAKGLQVHANTPVLRTKKLENGKYLVHTNRGEVICKKMIIATNAYTASVEPQFENKIIPIKGVCTRITAANPEERTPHLTNTYALRYSNDAFDYLINRPDGSVIVGGAKTVLFDQKDSFYNVVDDSTQIPGTKEYFTNYMKGRYYTWKNFDEKLDMIWTGILGFSNDALPYVGEIPGDKNKFIIAGFHGHGMPRVLLSSKALAKVINKETENLDIPAPFKITKTRMENTENVVLDSISPISVKAKF